MREEGGGERHVPARLLQLAVYRVKMAIVVASFNLRYFFPSIWTVIGKGYVRRLKPSIRPDFGCCDESIGFQTIDHGLTTVDDSIMHPVSCILFKLSFLFAPPKT